MKKVFLLTIMLATTFLFSCGLNSEEKAKAKQMVQLELTNAKGDLAVAYDKLETVKDFQIGRAVEQRAEQIKKQTMIIDELTRKVDNLATELKKYE